MLLQLPIVCASSCNWQRAAISAIFVSFVVDRPLRDAKRFQKPLCVGAFIGSHTLGRTSSRLVRFSFLVVLTVLAAQMLFKGVTA